MRHLRGVAHIDTWGLEASLYRTGAAQFDQVTLRQAYPGSPHRDTRAILLRVPGPILGALGPTAPHVDYAALAALWFEDVPHVDTPLLDGWPSATAVLEAVAQAVGVKREAFGKAMLVELKPQGAVAWHVDEGAYAPRYQRYHLPLVTNPMAFLFSGGEQVHAPVGCLTAFDTHVLHSAINLGAFPRIHLIVDVRREG